MWVCTQLTLIYIPYGSNKTSWQHPPPHKLEEFISHMVQIKPCPLARERAQTAVFISHMVQIKRILAMVKKKTVRDLYPIWFK